MVWYPCWPHPSAQPQNPPLPRAPLRQSRHFGTGHHCSSSTVQVDLHVDLQNNGSSNCNHARDHGYSSHVLDCSGSRSPCARSALRSTSKILTLCKICRLNGNFDRSLCTTSLQSVFNLNFLITWLKLRIN